LYAGGPFEKFQRDAVEAEKEEKEEA